MFNFNNFIKFFIEPLFSLNGCAFFDELSAPTNLENTSESNDQTPTITGKVKLPSGANNLGVYLYSGDTIIGTAWTNSDGDFSITSSSLSVDEHDLYATAVEGSNYSSPSDILTIKITSS